MNSKWKVWKNILYRAAFPKYSRTGEGDLRTERELELRVRWRSGFRGEMAGDGGVVYWSGGKSKMCTKDGKSERALSGLRLPLEHANEARMGE